MTTIRAKLKGVTQPVDDGLETPEELIAYCARVSNPSNQLNPDYAGLLNYCMRNKHWSIFEMVNAVVEVEAPRDITRQLLRHRSFSFQEFSQRYSDEIEFTDREFRRQDTKNRQNSIDDLAEYTVQTMKEEVDNLMSEAASAYANARAHGVAKECARVFLPEGLTMSKLYVNGTLRSYLTYLQVRLDPTTQLEHRLLAEEIKKCLEPSFPTVFEVFFKNPQGDVGG